MTGSTARQGGEMNSNETIRHFGGRNPYTPGTTDHFVWEQGASAALTAVQVAGEEGGEYVTNIVMAAEQTLGLGIDSDHSPATDAERDAGTLSTERLNQIKAYDNPTEVQR